MAKLFTREQAQRWLRENNLKDGKSIENAFIAEIKDVLQEALEEEMNEELGYSRYDWKNKNTDNSRNGHSKKKVKGQFGNIKLNIPRDTKGEFEPIIVKKHERTISSDLDGIVINVNQDGHVIKKTAYVVFAINVEGKKEIPGIWIGEAESSKFWMNILADLKNRGVKDILIASVDGLNGFEEAIRATFPKAEIQKCIVHQIRNSTKFVNYKDRKPFCADMREIYTAPNEEAGLAALDRFDEKWGSKYSYAIKSWRANWQSLSTFFKYSRQMILYLRCCI